MKSYICLDSQNNKLFVLSLSKNKMILNGVLWDYEIINMISAETGQINCKMMFIFNACQGPSLYIKEEIEI